MAVLLKARRLFEVIIQLRAEGNKQELALNENGSSDHSLRSSDEASGVKTGRERIFPPCLLVLWNPATCYGLMLPVVPPGPCYPFRGILQRCQSVKASSPPKGRRGSDRANRQQSSEKPVLRHQRRPFKAIILNAEITQRRIRGCLPLSARREMSAKPVVAA